MRAQLGYSMYNVHTVKIFMHMYMLIHRRCRVLTKKLEKVLIKNLTVTSKKTKQNKQQNLYTIDTLVGGQGSKTVVPSAEFD